jgi:hypothetical protein
VDMDNALFHRSERIAQMCADAGWNWFICRHTRLNWTRLMSLRWAESFH